MNYVQTSLGRPVFIVVQIISVAVIGLIVWFLWIFIFALPFDVRNSLYYLILQSGLVGPTAVWIIYAFLSLIILQQIIKAVIGVPLGSEAEPADVDYLFPAPMQGHVYFTAKYLRSIPRRLLFYTYAILAFQPILWFFGFKYGLTHGTFAIFMLIAFLFGEIGSIATHGLYFLRKWVSQSRPLRRIYLLVFYVALIIGTILLLMPMLIVSGEMIFSPTYYLANLFVALGSEGYFVYLHYPAIPGVLLGLFLALIFVLIITRFLSDRVTLDVFEEIATITRKRGTALGVLSRLPIEYKGGRTPLRAIFRKDTVTSLRQPGKAFYITGIILNYIFAILFIGLLPALRTFLPLPEVFFSFMEPLYPLLLIIIIPLLSITASDPFHGEYGSLYLIRLAPVSPLKFTFIKYLQLLLTPALLAFPFAIYFAVILGSLHLLLIALAIIPHAILLSTAIGIALGSRYPYATRQKGETPVALIITYPVLSWSAIIPVLIFQLGFLQSSLYFMLFSSLIVTPYTVGLTLILLSWSAHSYLRQE